MFLGATRQSADLAPLCLIFNEEMRAGHGQMPARRRARSRFWGARRDIGAYRLEQPTARDQAFEET